MKQHFTSSFKKHFLLASVILGCATVAAAKLPPLSIAEHIIFTVTSSQASCTTPPPLELTDIIRYSDSSTSKERVSLFENSPYSQLTVISFERVHSGTAPIHYVDHVTLEKDTFELKGGYLWDGGSRKKNNHGTWKNLKNNCSGTFVDTLSK